MIDQHKAKRLEQMGLGPVWALRQSGGHAGDDSHVARVWPSAHAPAPSSAEPPSGHAENTLPAMDWDTLESAIRECTRCGLCQGRAHAVPGIGDRQARWLFVGEGPGRHEDAQGEPFVGPAGKLLDNMLLALGLMRGKRTYIANVVKCRPVGDDGRDRPPSAEEAAACLPYLERQIALIKPEVIIALGKTAAASLLGVSDDTALSGLRGKPHAYAGIPLVVTYHPAYLLRKPADKAKSWQDLCLAQQLCDGR
ncbi:MAG: uracil-DNA glycosylase family protein [Oxalobacteraceae bacterium]